MAVLPLEYYQTEPVTHIARDLLGKVLHTRVNGMHTAGRIVETEAYDGRTDKACHAHLNKRTKRTEIMYYAGGVAYVYLTYGIHYLFNIVTNIEGKADAVLIRAVEPILGIDVMAERRNMEEASKNLTSGPGKLSQAMGITKALYGASLLGSEIWIEDDGHKVKDEILARERVGIAYAQEDALLPWRYSIMNNKWVSPAVANYTL